LLGPLQGYHKAKTKELEKYLEPTSPSHQVLKKRLIDIAEEMQQKSK
jgi:hypothetical protein